MILEPLTLQERRAVSFIVRLIRDYGYGYTIHVPSRQLSGDLFRYGYPISFITIRSYWDILEHLGIVSREMNARKHGVVYHIKRYPIKKMMEGDDKKKKRGKAREIKIDC